VGAAGSALAKLVQGERERRGGLEERVLALLRRLVQPAGTSSWVHSVALRRVLRARGVDVSVPALTHLVMLAVPSAHCRRARDHSSPDRRRGWRGVGWTEEGREAAAWELRLERAGLEPEEPDGRHEALADGVMVGDGAEARETYYRLAEQHLQAWPFKNARERQIWGLHAEGASELEISSRMGVGRGAVRRVILRHRRHAGITRKRRTLEQREAMSYMAETDWASERDRRIWWLAEVEGYCAANVAAELRVELAVVRKVLAFHRARRAPALAACG
jgi:hypothetical protein